MSVKKKRSRPNSFCSDHRDRSNEKSILISNGAEKFKKKRKKKNVKIRGCTNVKFTKVNESNKLLKIKIFPDNLLVTNQLEFSELHPNKVSCVNVIKEKDKVYFKKNKKLNILSCLEHSLINNSKVSIETRGIKENVIVSKTKPDIASSININSIAINENIVSNGVTLNKKKRRKKKLKALTSGEEEKLVAKDQPIHGLPNNDFKGKLNHTITNGLNSANDISKCNGVSNTASSKNFNSFKNNTLKYNGFTKVSSSVNKISKFNENNTIRKKRLGMVCHAKNSDFLPGSIESTLFHLETFNSGKLSRKKKKQLRDKIIESKVQNSRNSATAFVNTNAPPKKIGSMSISDNNIQRSPQKIKLNGVISTNQTQPKHRRKHSNTIGNVSLPIYEVEDHLIKFVLSNETSILVGETGCGKSTQVPQFLYAHGLHKNGLICVTQPRKIAAISLSRRVAEEMGSEIGNVVGYAVRFDEKISGQTKLKYVTDGMLLREALSDPLLLKYQWIILDEAHERTVNTDILFGIVKKAQKIRKLKGKKLLRVIIMSATMDVDRFIAYFGNADAKVIKGRQHEILYSFVSNSQKDYNLMCLTWFLKLHEKHPVKDGFLIFLTGQDEIEHFVKQIRKINTEKEYSHLPDVEAYPLYAQLPDQEQGKVFKSQFMQRRKVIVSTNVAETSLTIPGISVVIDSCHFKTRFQNQNTGFEELRVESISRAQAEQRAGRAGRLGPGFYYSVLTKEEFETLRENPTPEILKSELSSTYVTLLGAGVQNVMKFDYFDRPPMTHLRMAEVDLRDLAAICGHGDSISLSELGQNLKYLPLKPQFGKILLKSAELGCTEEILTIISLLSCENIYVNPTGKQEEAKFQRRRFRAIEGDHITFLNVYNAFKATTNSKTWCHKNYLNYRNMVYAANVRAQLAELCEKRKIPIVSCQLSEDPYKVNREPILKSLISGLFKNVARREGRGKYKCLTTQQEVFIHPGSLLFGGGPEFMLFTNVTCTGKQYMNINSVIDPLWLKEVCPNFFNKIDLPILDNIFTVVC